jgi:hypothetical protein
MKFGFTTERFQRYKCKDCRFTIVDKTEVIPVKIKEINGNLEMNKNVNLLDKINWVNITPREAPIDTTRMNLPFFYRITKLKTGRTVLYIRLFKKAIDELGLKVNEYVNLQYANHDPSIIRVTKNNDPIKRGFKVTGTGKKRTFWIRFPIPETQVHFFPKPFAYRPTPNSYFFEDKSLIIFTNGASLENLDDELNKS